MRPIVFLAVSIKDAGLATKWLAWHAAIHPPSGPERPVLMVLYDQELSHRQYLNLSAAAEAAGAGVASVVIPREYAAMTYGVSANLMFKAALVTCEQTYPGHPMIWCEPDTVPMHTGWADEIQCEYEECDAVFLGDFHPDGNIPHMTGVSVYPANWRELSPCLAALPGKDMECGWDTQCSHETVPLMTRSKTIQQIWRPPVFTKHNAGVVRPGTALFHQCKDGSLIDVLCERQGFRKIPLIQEAQEKEHMARFASSDTFMNTEIFIVTCQKDMPYLKACIQSIAKYARGFSGTTLVVPASEDGLYDWAQGLTPLRIHYFQEYPNKGFLGHLIEKCKADLHCPYAQSILHLDADCMAMGNVRPEDYAPDARPIIIRESYEAVGKRNENRLYWQKTVENALGFTPEWECMTRHPQIYLRETYSAMRAAVEAHTGMGFEEYVLAGQNTFPQSFCEFNTLGAIALRDTPERYTIKDYDRAAVARGAGVKERETWQHLYQQPDDKFCEFWSGHPISVYEKTIKQILAGSPPGYVLK